MLKIKILQPSTAAFFVAAGLVCISGQGFANKTTKKGELYEVQARIKAVQKTLGDLEVKKNSVAAQLRDSERLFGEISVILRSLERDMREQEKQLFEVRRRRDEGQESIRAQRTALIKQIRASHAMGRQEPVKLVLNQEDPAKITRLLTYYQYFNAARVAQLKSLETALNALQKSETELLQRSESLRRLRQGKEVELKSLAETRRVRKDLLAKLELEYKDRNSELKRLKANERQLRKLLRSIERAIGDVPFKLGQTKPFGKLRGKLDWPVKGRLLKRFGYRKIVGRWEGVLIGAKEGARVRAVSKGRVVYADWLRGYGLLLILDHGGGYMTLYAFNESLYKKVGDKVNAGDEISSVGRSGGRSRPGLYFEIRKKGKPVNPIKWCKKVRKGRVG